MCSLHGEPAVGTSVITKSYTYVLLCVGAIRGERLTSQSERSKGIEHPRDSVPAHVCFREVPSAVPAERGGTDLLRAYACPAIDSGEAEDTNHVTFKALYDR